MTLLKTMFVIFLLTVLGVSVVWQRVQVVRLGYVLQEIQSRSGQLKEENRRLLYEVNALCAPDRLISLVREGRLPLAEPRALVRLELVGGGDAFGGGLSEACKGALP